MVFSFAWLPLADATAISYVSSLYIVLLAGPVLGEIVGLRRYLAVVAGIAGALLISKPGMTEISWLYLAVLVGTMFNSWAVILTKYLRREDHAITILLYVQLLQLIGFLPGVLEPWNISGQWFWIICLVVTGPLGMYCGIVALQYADASVLAPYAYVRLVIVTFAAIILFGETPSLLSVAGACMIVAACWYSTASISTTISAPRKRMA